MKQYMKKITAFILALICVFTAVPSTATYAKTAPSVHTTGMIMTVGECFTLRTENVDTKWTADQRYIKIENAETGDVKLTALKAGNVVVKAKSSKLNLKFEIKIKKHPLQNKKTSVSIYSACYDAEGNQATMVVWSHIKGAEGYKLYQKSEGKMKRVKTIKDAKTCRVLCKPQKDADGYDDNQFYVRAYTINNGVAIYSKYATAKVVFE